MYFMVKLVPFDLLGCSVWRVAPSATPDLPALGHDPSIQPILQMVPALQRTEFLPWVVLVNESYKEREKKLLPKYVKEFTVPTGLEYFLSST